MKAQTFSEFTDQLLGMQEGEVFVYDRYGGSKLQVHCFTGKKYLCNIFHERTLLSSFTTSSSAIPLEDRKQVYAIWESTEVTK